MNLKPPRTKRSYYIRLLILFFREADQSKIDEIKKSSVASEKTIKQRENVMNELITTEEKYLKDIEIFVTHYVTPLRSTKFPEIESHTQAYLTVFLPFVFQF
jgi:hypothetical protein